MGYKCLCGHKATFKSSMESHMRTCPTVRRKLESRQGSSVSSNTDLSLIDAIVFTEICSDLMDTCSYSDTSDCCGSSYDGGGGSFDGGGSSGDY